MRRFTVDDLPSDPLAAAGLFQQQWLAQVERALESGEDAMIALPSADHTHIEWRRAVAAGLARKHAPHRCNVVAGEGAALEGLQTYLVSAPGITGQYLETDAEGAGDPA